MTGKNAPISLISTLWSQSTPVWPQLFRQQKGRQGSELVGSLKATVSCPVLTCEVSPEEWAMVPWRLSRPSSSQPHGIHTQLLGSQEEGEDVSREEGTWPWSPFGSPHSRFLFRGLQLSFLDPLPLGPIQTGKMEAFEACSCGPGTLLCAL